MNKYVEVLIEENKGESVIDTLTNLNYGIKYVLTLDDGRLTRREQEVLNILGQADMIACYAEAIKIISKEL